jgi:hypothetical protein
VQREDDESDFSLAETDVFPLDWKQLVKGQTLTADQCADASGVRKDHRRFPFALLSLRDFIMRQSAMAGTPYSVRVVDSGLHINTDSEAVGYHDNRAKINQRGIFRQLYMLNKAVDPTKLSSDEQQRHTRALCVWGAKVGALKKATRQPLIGNG